MYGFSVFKIYDIKYLIWETKKYTHACAHVCPCTGVFLCVLIHKMISMRFNVERALSSDSYLTTSVFISAWFWNVWYNFSKTICLSF